MKILKFKLLKDFARKHPDAADPLMRWAEFVEKTEWKSFIKDRIKEILRYKPEAVFADNAMFSLYPIVHALRKKHIPVLTAVEKDGQKLLVRIPSGS